MKRFFKINDNLYRGGAPSKQELLDIINNYKIKKVISLDKKVGNSINQFCISNDINHIIIPMRLDVKGSISHLFSHDLDELFANGPIFIHCYEGKDRTGLASAIYRCKFEDWTCEKALKEALGFGFCSQSPDDVYRLFCNLIKLSCKHEHDHITKQDNDINLASDIPLVGITSNPTGLRGNIGLIDGDGSGIFSGNYNAL